LRRKALPTLKYFSEQFLQAIRTRCASKPRTIEFYAQQVRYILTFEPIANRQLDEIDEALIEGFAQVRRRKSERGNDQPWVAVLRRMVRLANEWRIIARVPRLHLLRGERNREFVLNREQERIYLEFAPRLATCKCGKEKRAIGRGA